MADNDFLSYSSIYESFSKGPKSIYYGIGDETLPGGILNVPQDDSDDEWGRTQRILDERTLDYIAKIYKTLFDPYNSIPSISLTPGESGSEVNVAKNLIRLVGRTGIDAGVFNLEVPSLTLCGVSISGATNTISIGCGFEASGNSLKLNTNFISTGSSTNGNLSFKHVSMELFDDAVTYKYSIRVNNGVYVFSEAGGTPLFELPAGGMLKLTGELNTGNLFPGVTCGVIGSESRKYRELYVEDIYSNTLRTPLVQTSRIIPLLSDGTPVTIGAQDNLSNVVIRSKDIRVYNNSEALPAITLCNSKITLGSFAIDYIVGVKASYFEYYSTDPYTPVFYANSTGIYLNMLTHSDNIYPKEHATYDIGTLALSYRTIFADKVNVNSGVFSDNTAGWEINGPELDIIVCGLTKLSVSRGGIGLQDVLTTESILPKENNTYSMGNPAFSYDRIYASRLIASTGLYCDSETTWEISGPALIISSCGITQMALTSSHIRFSTNLHSESIFPSAPMGKYIGNGSAGFEALFLRDRVTGSPVQIYVCNGALYPN